MSVGLVHDYLLVMRGAERTFSEMAECWPGAPVYTLLYDEGGTGARFSSRTVRTSYLQLTRASQRNFRHLLAFFPRAARALPIQEHDTIVSSSSAFAHMVRRRSDAVHVCYCHSPFRYAWFERERALAETPRPLRPAVRRALDAHRGHDLRAAAEVTHYITNSALSRRRIQDFWNRDASVIHPPVDVDRFRTADPEDYLLVVTELVPHKRVDVALEAARRAGWPVRVVGTGPQLGELRRRYGSTARFLGRVPDAELAELYARAAALVLPNVEEFGIAAVEAQAAGRPVVAAAAGGALETVVDGQTGVLVTPGDVDAMAEALRETDFGRFEPARLTHHAARFSAASFKQRLRLEVERLTGAVGRGQPQVAAQAA
jgi:glycosyltransferase involved in cell wall biosynthesis